jgi:tetratricopeptide (TPR) repeat protein
MERPDITRKEVEAKLINVGDYVKMDFLQRCLKKNLDFDTKRFVMIKLSAVYEARMMYLEAGKIARNVADINTTFEGKFNDFSKSMELYVRGGNYEEAEVSFKKALACANEKQKTLLKAKFKVSLNMRAKELMSKDKRKNAMEVYEKFIQLPFIDANERKEAQSALTFLYQKLGKIRELYSLQKDMANPQPIKPKIEEKRYDDFNVDDLLR